MKNILVISNKVNSYVGASMRDCTIFLYKNLQQAKIELGIEAKIVNKVYITEDVFTSAGVISPPMLTSVLELVTDLTCVRTQSIEVLFTESPETREKIEFANKYLKYDRDSIDLKFTAANEITYDFVSRVVTSEISTDNMKPQRTALVRQKKSEYIEQEKLKKLDLTKRVELVEERIQHSTTVNHYPIYISEGDKISRTIYVAGREGTARTTFVYLLAQYLSLKGKTVILEKDPRFLTLTDLVARGAAEVSTINVADIYNSETRMKTFSKVRFEDNNLIAFVNTGDFNYDYNFTYDLLFANLSIGEGTVRDVEYFIKEASYEEVTSTNEYIALVDSQVCEFIKDLDRVPELADNNVTFLVVNSSTIEDVLIDNTESAKEIIRDILQLRKAPTFGVRINGINLGENIIPFEKILRGERHENN